METTASGSHETGTYRPISDYGAIGNLRTTALVSRDGAIDWCCLPHLDRPAVFAALLDSRRGGRFRVTVAGAGAGTQSYWGQTNILQTVFRGDEGELMLSDWMPLEGDIDGCGKSAAEPEIHRLAECTQGNVEVEVEWAPRFDYARTATHVERDGEVWLATGGDETLTLTGLPGAEATDGTFGPAVRARVRLQAGERLILVTRWGRHRLPSPNESLTTLEETRRIWKEWSEREGLVEKRVWAGEWRDMVTRSALAFKLLTHADTGAIAAAATTSLPGDVGGVRNWDYRFAWLRDAAQTAQALVSLGHDEEAVDLLYWTERVAKAAQDGQLELQIMYTLHGEQELAEETLDHLEGYRGSRPVRIGNEAAQQFQLETYGELLNTGYEIVRRGHELTEEMRHFLAAVADHVCGVWQRPDKGIWEFRGPERHFVYSKVMAWVALDRAVLLAERNGFPGDVATWRETAGRIRHQVLEQGYSAKLGAFVQSYGTEELDASNLRIPLVEFLPADDPRMASTIDRTLEQLTKNGLVLRYKNDDGLPGHDGAFGLCTFWMVDCLALSGRTEKARALLEGMVRRSNHVGLFSEQIHPETAEFQGNFPQAYTHIGLVNSALYLAYAEGREIPEHAPIGTEAHRQKAQRDRA